MAFNEFYDPKHNQPPVFLNKSVNCPRVDPGLRDVPQRKCYRHLPWNYCLWNENLNTVFLKSDLRIPEGTDKLVLPPINIINLSHRYDRLAELALHLKTRIFTSNVFPAIKRSPGYLGCSLSHIALIKEAKRKGDPMLIVMEDDCMPTCENFEQRFIQVLKWLHGHMDQWEVFNSLPLGFNFGYIDKVLDRDIGIVRTLAGCNTQLIVYNQSCYDRLISLEEEYTGTGDRQTEMYFAWDVILSRTCEMVTCLPFLTNSYSQESDITHNGIAHDQPMRNFRMIQEWDSDNAHHLKGGFHPNSDVTVIMTACYRYPELVRTLDSFLEHNSYPVKRIVISEENWDSYQRFYDRYVEYIRKGQICLIAGKGNHMDSIDQLSTYVDTPYFFHLEEDWYCTRPYFIEQSKIIMDADPDVLCVWLRDLNDTNKHPIGEYQRLGGIHCWKMAYGYNKNWHGFTFNPSLRRRSDIIKFSDFKDKGMLPEELVSMYYKDKGKYAAILPVAHFYHIGYHTTYNPLFKKRTNAVKTGALS